MGTKRKKQANGRVPLTVIHNLDDWPKCGDCSRPFTPGDKAELETDNGIKWVTWWCPCGSCSSTILVITKRTSFRGDAAEEIARSMSQI